MEYKALIKRSSTEQNDKLRRNHLQFENLLKELKNKELTNSIISAINNDIEHLNSIVDSDKTLNKEIKKIQTRILRSIEKELKLVTINHYRNTWLAIGMSVFGVPMGVVFGIIFSNMAFIGIGLPLGMAFGILIGTSMDKKAIEEGRQLDLEIK